MGAMTPCEKLPALLRATVPVGILCALVGLLLPASLHAQSHRPAPSSPPPARPAVEASVAPALAHASPEAAPIERIVGPRFVAPGPGELLLARALEGAPGGRGTGSDLSSLRDLLPGPLYHDMVELRDRVVRVRSRVFGRRGIFSLGQAGEEDDVGRLRVNLQYSPDPGIRVTLITR